MIVHHTKTIGFCVGTGLFAYVAYKAATASFTHDESYSFLVYAQASWSDIWNYHHVTANNHLLNSLAMKLSGKLFGFSELSLRLHSILAFALFLFAGFRIARMLPNQLVVPAFVLLSCNPYLLDFFAIARGYGMAIAFSLMALYLLMRYRQTQRLWQRAAALVFALLTALSNLTLLYFACGVLVIGYLPYFENGKLSWSLSRGKLLQLLAIDAAFAGLIFMLVWPAAQLLQEHGQLYYGGTTGFWHDTVTSLVNSLLYAMNRTQGLVTSMVVAAGAAFLGAGVVLLGIWPKQQAPTSRTVLEVSFVVLLVASLASVGNHYLLDAKLIIHRTALFLVPLFLVVVLSAVATIRQFRLARQVCFTITWLVALAALVHCGVQQRPETIVDWGYDSQTKTAVFDIVRAHGNSGSSTSVQIGSDGLFAPTVEFYRVTQKLDWIEPVSREGIDPTKQYDYLFVRQYSEPITGYSTVAMYPNGFLEIRKRD